MTPPPQSVEQTVVANVSTLTHQTFDSFSISWILAKKADFGSLKRTRSLSLVCNHRFTVLRHVLISRQSFRSQDSS